MSMVAFVVWMWRSVFDKDWNVTLNTPEALKALEVFVESAQYFGPRL